MKVKYVTWVEIIDAAMWMRSHYFHSDCGKCPFTLASALENTVDQYLKERYLIIG